MSRATADAHAARRRHHAVVFAALGDETRLLGAFRACGLLVPVWDLEPGTTAEAVEDPATVFSGRLAEAQLALGYTRITSPVDGCQRAAPVWKMSAFRDRFLGATRLDQLVLAAAVVELAHVDRAGRRRFDAEAAEDALVEVLGDDLDA